MMKFNKKALMMLVCVTMLLTCTVSGTVAYLVDASDSVVNEFTPSTVDISTEDKIDGGTKKDVVIKNNSTIPVYIRVAVIANWYNDAGEIVAPWNETVYGALPVSTDWTKCNDGYYYYTKAVQPSESSISFFAANASYTPTPTVEDAHLEMTIIAQAIQAEPETTVESVWPVEVNNKVLTLKSN